MNILQNEESGIIQCKTKQRQFQVLYVSDMHLDHPKAKVHWLHTTLDKYKDSWIIIGGDSIDVMQFKGDQRSEKSNVIPDVKATDYANKIVNFLRTQVVQPYGNRILAWNRGNHDNDVIRQREVDILSWVLDGTGVPIGDFAGYIVFTYDEKGHSRNSVLYYQHAPSSGGRRSKGMLSVDILKGQAPDADVILTEHIHQNWITLHKVQKLNIYTKEYINKYIWFVQNPSLKAEDEGRKNGYYQEKIKGGGLVQGIVKLDFTYIRDYNGAKLLKVEPSLIPCME